MISAIKAVLNTIEVSANVINKTVGLADRELDMLAKQQELRSIELDAKLSAKATALGITL